MFEWYDRSRAPLSRTQSRRSVNFFKTTFRCDSHFFIIYSSTSNTTGAISHMDLITSWLVVLSLQMQIEVLTQGTDYRVTEAIGSSERTTLQSASEPHELELEQ